MSRPAPLVVGLAVWVGFALGGCAAPDPLPGMDRLESARVLLADDRPEEALALAEAVLEPGDGEVALEDEAEASYLVGQSALRLGKHLKAYRAYRRILEQAPWSPHAGDLVERLYEIGVAFLHDDRYGGWFDARGRGVEVLETLHIHFRRSPRAEDALRLIGDWFAGIPGPLFVEVDGQWRVDQEMLAALSPRDWIEAALTYEDLYKGYPDSKWAPRALWLAGHCRLRDIDGPTYNREGLLRAAELLDMSVLRHPRGPFAHQARADLAEARETLAVSELSVADFYRDRGRSEGEQVRLANAALLYPDTNAGQEARARLEALGIDPGEGGLVGASMSSVDKVRATRLEWEP